MSGLENAGYSKASAYYGKSGNPLGYQVEVWHDGLNEHRVIRDKDFGILESKVRNQLLKWDEKWQRVKAKQEEAERRQRGKEGADAATRDAQEAMRAAEGILAWTLDVDDTVDWSELKRHEPFRFEPHESTKGIRLDPADGRPIGIEPVQRSRQPTLSDRTIAPRNTLLDKIIPPFGRKREAEAEERLKAALERWQSEEDGANREEAKRGKRFDHLRASYERAKEEYEKACAEQEARVDDLRRRWLAGEPDAVEEHAELVLGASEYPDWIHADYTVAYDAANGVLVVDYELPPVEVTPTLKEVTYVASRDEYKEKHITEAQKKKLYDSILYQIAIRTVHELFEADESGALAMITFNGWVTSVNPGTGKSERKCILSLQTGKEEFQEVDLSQVDPKACFKALKGVAASSLAELAPVTPLLQFDSDDARFVESRDIADGLGNETNLAAMDWEDFEHLVRELFSKHFEKDGGEVHVTQASRDGGVDAIAFDPDPIRGGKMVIQAKRYTNTVGVSAVRDLYGTVVNEGAVKGILITTSDYGPDAYAFAKDKPLALLSGANLLHLLAEHGYKATINIEEAKRFAREAR
ncbi:restriction endonuclease [Arhodomonas sp. SL1]|uniref:restriction endonuclease n=1 Tax=Arhodomonas sp. SL1 TaxID=3425691 RepID=UPI003F880325